MSYKKEKKYLGLDWGKRKIGLALGDDISFLAIPWKVVFSFEQLKESLAREDIHRIILGYPVKLSGKKESLPRELRIFKQKLEENFNVPVELFDERLTSRAADRLAGSKKDKAPQDAIAAMLILQSYFDRKKAGKPEP